MSNPWAQSFEDLRSPYLQEKKAKKDYDGDGKIESGAKEYRGVVHNKIQKAKGGKADGQDTSSVKEEKHDDSKVSMRFGDKKQKERKEKLEKKRGMKLGKHPQFESKAMKSYLDKKAKKLEGDKKKQSAPYKNNPAFGDPSHHSNKKNRMEHHQKDADGNVIPHGDGTPSSKEDIVLESDKKGKGSGTKDACYHKVKSRYSVWPSAYASGALVKCRKVGAKNWGNSSKKEEFDYYQMPMKSFGDMVGECWKTHKKVGMKMKGGKMVPDCRPKNESVEEAVKNPKLAIKETGVKNKIQINPEIKTEAAKAPVKK